MSPPEIDYLGEGPSDDAMARKIIVTAACLPGTSYRRPLSGTGKESLDKRLRGLNAGAAYGRPILVLRDLNRDASCPAELVARLLPNRHDNMLLSVCVREAEAWLIADAETYARFCGLPLSQVPARPETLADPKSVILGSADSGRAPRLKRHVDDGRRRGVPDWALLGEWHAEFVQVRWNPIRAASSGRAPSLCRALARLRRLASGR
jgi:hypothetical protein